MNNNLHPIFQQILSPYMPEENKVRNLLHEFWNRSSDACPLEASEQERQEKEWEQWYESQSDARIKELDSEVKIKQNFYDSVIHCLISNKKRFTDQAGYHHDKFNEHDACSQIMKIFEKIYPFELQNKVEFYRETTDKVRELISGRKDIGEPCQPLYDAIYDKLKELEGENERLKGLIENIFYKYGIGYIGSHGISIEEFKQQNNL